LKGWKGYRSNPAQGIGNTKYQVPKSGILTLEELSKLFPADSLKPWKDLFDYTAFLVAAATGMRKGEVLALRWMDIDFDRRLVRARTAWKDRNQIGILKGGEERVTPILLWPDLVIDHLQELYADKKVVSPMDLVFCYADGRRMGGTWWQKRWTAALKEAGVDRESRHLTPHGVRRTLNSLLRAANKDPAKIRAALGWKQEVTQNGYTEFKAKDLEDLRLE
jgi:integrase